MSPPSDYSRAIGRDEVLQIIEEYESGSSMAAIAAQHSRGLKAIKNLLHRARVDTSRARLDPEQITEIRQEQKRLSAEEVGQLIVEYQDGATVYELAEQFGCHRKTVSACLKSHGISMRYKPLTEEQAQEAVRLYESGLSLTKVGEIVGASPGTIRARLLERGVTTRDTHGRCKDILGGPHDSDTPESRLSVITDEGGDNSGSTFVRLGPATA